MEKLIYEERYVDEFENYFLPDAAGPGSCNEGHLVSEECIVSGFSDSIHYRETCKSEIVAEENKACTSSISPQAKQDNCYTDADVADVHLDFNRDSGGVIDGGKIANFFTSPDFEKVELLSENLSKIIHSFKKCKDSCEKFLGVYPSWSKKRKKVIAQLKEISEDLDQVKCNSNIAKITGSSVGVAGGITSVVGAVLIPFSMGVSTPLMIGGMVTSSLGGLTSLGTAVTEVCLLKQKIKEAQAIVKDDKKDFNVMAEWFNHAEAYVHAVDGFLGLNVIAKMDDTPQLHNLLTRKSKLKMPCSSLSGIIAKTLALEPSGVQKEVLYVAEKFLPRTLHGLVIPLSIILAIAANPNLIELFQEMIQLHKDNPLLYEAITMIYRLQILKCADMQANCVTCVNTVAKFGTMTVSATVGKTLCHTLFAGLSVAIDVMSLVLTSIDFHKGSQCHSAERVREVNEQLSSAFGIIESVYLELHRCQMND